MVVDRDLGLADDMNVSDYKNKKVNINAFRYIKFGKNHIKKNIFRKVFLYIREKSVVGILVTEPIKTAYRMIPELIDLNCCTAESTPTKCGINVIWTAMSHRRQGIATKLVDILR